MTTTSCRSEAEAEPAFPAMLGVGTAAPTESRAQKELLESSAPGLVRALLSKTLPIKVISLGALRRRYAEIVHRTCGSRASCE